MLASYLYRIPSACTKSEARPRTQSAEQKLRAQIQPMRDGPDLGHCLFDAGLLGLFRPGLDLREVEIASSVFFVLKHGLPVI